MRYDIIRYLMKEEMLFRLLVISDVHAKHRMTSSCHVVSVLAKISMHSSLAGLDHDTF